MVRARRRQARAVTRRPITLADRLRDAPHRFDPVQAVHALEHGGTAVGGAALPVEEPLRFATVQSLAFAPSALVATQASAGRVDMVQAFLGLTGPLGVLPQMFSELVIRAERSRNQSLGAFHDIFVRRLASLFVRAAAKYRHPALVQADRVVGTDPISFGMLALAGFGAPHLRGRITATDEALLFFAGLFANRNRSAAGLEVMLGDYLACGVTVIQFQERWISVPPAEQTSMPGPAGPGQFNRLGVDSFAGARVRDAQGAFRIRIGPLRLARFRALLPGGGALRALIELVRLYAGPALAFDIQVVLAREDIPPLQLSPDTPPRLGWTSWAVSLPALDDSDALVLNPDRLELGSE